MKKLLLGVAAASFLAACGGGSGKQVLVDACVEDSGESAKVCGCMVDVLKDNTTKDQFKAAVKAAEDGGDMDEAMEDIFGDMESFDDPAQMAKLMEMGAAMMKCEPESMNF